MRAASTASSACVCCSICICSYSAALHLLSVAIACQLAVRFSGIVATDLLHTATTCCDYCSVLRTQTALSGYSYMGELHGATFVVSSTRAQ
jgi:hypothetical protein